MMHLRATNRNFESEITKLKNKIAKQKTKSKKNKKMIEFFEKTYDMKSI